MTVSRRETTRGPMWMWLAVAASVVGAVTLTHHYVALTMHNVIGADVRATASLTMSDFRDAIWYPAKEMAAGGNPYDFAAYTASHLGEYPPYTPAQLTVFWPLAHLSWPSSAAVYLVVMGLTVIALGSWVGTTLLRGIRPEATWTNRPAVWLAAAALGIVGAWLYRPIPAAFGPGQPSLVYGTAAAAALLVERCPRAVRALLVSVACLKPTIGFPVLLLLLCQRRTRVVAVGGFLITFALSVPAVLAMSRAAGGVGAWLTTAVGSVTGTQQSRLAATGAETDADLWVDLFALFRAAAPGVAQPNVAAVCALLLLLAVVSAVRWSQVPALGALTVLTASLVTLPHGGYDALWLFAPALLGVREVARKTRGMPRVLMGAGLAAAVLGGLAISHQLDGLIGGLSPAELQRPLLSGATILLITGLGLGGRTGRQGGRQRFDDTSAHSGRRLPPPTGRVRYLLLATHVSGDGSGGGIIRYTVELARALAQFDEVELHVLASRRSTTFFAGIIERSHIHTLPDLNVPLRSVIERHVPLWLLTRMRFDIVHGTKHLIPRWSGKALKVITVHDMLPLDRPHDFRPAKRLLLRRPYLRSATESDVVIAVSRATLARLLDYRPQLDGAAYVVPLAVSQRLAEVEPESIPELVGRRFALVVGDGSARKNRALAVDTWPEVLRRCPDAVLAVAGPRAWAAEHCGDGWSGLVSSGVIRPLGHVADSQLRWCYEHAAGVLCPSLLEGFGLPTVEGGALGASVLTSDDPALCEAAPEGTVHVAGWSRERWAPAVAELLLGGRRPTAAPCARSWMTVAAETLAAIRGTRPAELMATRPVPERVRDRSGVSPFDAPLTVFYAAIGNEDQTRAEKVGAAQRHHGWNACVGHGDAHQLRHSQTTVVWGDSVARAIARGGHAPVAGSTVLYLGDHRPRLPRDLRLVLWAMRYADAVILSSGAAATAWGRYPVPLAVVPTEAGTPEVMEFSAVIARARAWGR